MAKEFLYRGKTVDELKKMSLDEFAKLVTSRPRRALLRPMNDERKKLMADIKENDAVKTHARDMPIIPAMLGKKISVYNGKQFVDVTITERMLGYRLGDMVMTRKEIKHSAPGLGATRSSKFVPLK